MDSYTVRFMETLPWVKISVVLVVAFGIAAALTDMPARGLLGLAGVASLLLMTLD